jgi:hypothetical protein
MAIVANELIWRRPAEVSDAGTNGGRMTMTAIPSAVKNNIWPDVPQSERTAGSTKYRKVFIHVANDNDLTLISPKVFVLMPTPGDDRVTFIPGTQTNTQSGVTGSEQKYGAGTLNASVIAGATSIQVAVEKWSSDPIFATGLKIRISDKQSIGGAGNEEYATITGAPGVSGDLITLNLTAGLTNGYSNATPTYVSTVWEPGDVACSSAWGTETTTLGTYNESSYPLILDNLGTIEQLWTLTFTSATAFNASGNTVGPITAGATTTNYIPVNPATGKPYFTLQSAGFGGTWATNDTITFTTHPASIPLWYRRVIDAGANSLSGNKVIVAVDGESA